MAATIRRAAGGVALALALAATGGATTALAEACAPPAAGVYEHAGPPRAAFPDDPLFDVQEHLDAIRVPRAWSRGFLGDGATIAVVDSGIDFDHPEFAGRLLPGIDTFEQLPGKDDCPPGPVAEQDPHGVGVAGIAAAAADNGIGLAGVAPKAMIIPIRAFDDVEGGESPQAMAAGIRYAADHGADVINASFTAGLTGLDRLETEANRAGIHLPDRDMAALADAVDYAWRKGSVIVASAGNAIGPPAQIADAPICAAPARFPNVVCVVGTEADGTPTPVSHLAVREDGGIVVAAPAFRDNPATDCTGIVTTWPGRLPFSNGHPLYGPDCAPLARGYTWFGATSAAAPQVSGVVALMRAAGLSPAATLDRLRTTSSNRGRWDPVYGYGLVDAEAALAGVAGP